MTDRQGQTPIFVAAESGRTRWSYLLDHAPVWT